MAPEQARRGQPVVFLALLIAAWVLVRVVTWHPPWPMLPSTPLATQALQLAGVSVPGDTINAASDLHVEHIPGVSLEHSLYGVIEHPVLVPVERPVAPPDFDGNFATDQRAAGLNLLWMAGMAALPVPREVEAALLRSTVPLHSTTPDATPGERKDRNWRVDAWLLLRDGASPRLASGSRPATYGASQIGAVLSYRLSPGTGHDPAAYTRASHALVEDGESELALGLRARPLRQVPLVAHVELRATRRAYGTELRPAVFVSGGFEDGKLPLGLVASSYVQAGAIGGDFDTAFVDGAMRIDRRVLDRGTARLDAGLGAWGGAQRDASRLDLGPTAGLKLDIGGAPTRIAADWRVRVAGNAEPSNGAAITLSTGF